MQITGICKFQGLLQVIYRVLTQLCNISIMIAVHDIKFEVHVQNCVLNTHLRLGDLLSCCGLGLVFYKHHSQWYLSITY